MKLFVSIFQGKSGKKIELYVNFIYLETSQVALIWAEFLGFV